jgi:hypothetical protein
MNPYGVCHHTKYAGCHPCIHEAWEAGYESAQKDAQDAVWVIPYTEIDSYPFVLRHEVMDAIRGER